LVLTAVIQLEKVSKKFALDISRPRSLQEMFVRRRVRREDEGYFWALRDISFQAGVSERVALIGANGSGKSTLLKLISKVLEPTSGKVSTRGRIAGLLELGTGFHPDLTGRENIYLNGSILGLPRRAIEREIDAIIDFADIGQFIDVQVRNYSSGMAVRLGFAITTILQPDILLIDEVLAVGDANFQRKCMARLEELQTQGVTLIFVSHGMDQVRRLCTRALWIDDSRIKADGEVESVVGMYLDAQAPLGQRYVPAFALETPATEAKPSDATPVGKVPAKRWGNFRAEIVKVEFLNTAGECPPFFKTGDFFRMRLHYKTHTRIEAPTFGMAFYRLDGTHINGPNSYREGYQIPFIEGAGYVDYIVEHLPLNHGEYEVTAVIYNYDSTVPYDHQHRIHSLEVRAPGAWHEEGIVHVTGTWQHTPVAIPEAQLEEQEA
jgi:ABC-type polysaccharide/polyol phosphate transport system ATPase subunit